MPNPLPPLIHLIGASGRSGQALYAALAQTRTQTIPIIRNPQRWHAANLPGPPRLADLTNPTALAEALHDAQHIVSCAHARHAAAILAAAPPQARFIFLGSTRKFTQWPDDHARGVLAGEAAFLAAHRPGLMLHPTMIYGAQGENNVQRLAALLRRLPLVPLPNGGRSLVQPIYQNDVTASILAALQIPWQTPKTMVIAGPTPLTYADFVRAIAQAAHLPPPRIINAPLPPLLALAPLTRLIPGLPTITPDELRRLTENKSFDITPMQTHLHLTPTPLKQGLAQIWP